MKLAAVLLTVATLATAATVKTRGLYYDEKLPWEPSPSTPCKHIWFDMFKPSTTLARIERRCGTQPVCRQFEKSVSHDMWAELKVKYGFSSEEECCEKHELDPKKKCWRALKSLRRSADKGKPISRLQVDIPCGLGAFCHAFSPASKFKPDVRKRLVALYNFQNEAECLAVEPEVPAAVLRQQKKEQKEQQQAADDKCDKIKQRLYWSPARLDRETIDSVCGVGQFCALFDPEKINDDDAARVLVHIYGYRSEEQCLDIQQPDSPSECSQAKMNLLGSTQPIAPDEIEHACGAGTFCSLFRPGALVGLKQSLYFGQIYGFHSEWDCQQRQPTIVKEQTRCAAAKAALDNLSANSGQNPPTRASVDGPCGGGTFCRKFDVKKSGEKLLASLRSVYGYVNVQDCINGEAQKMNKTPPPSS